MISGPMSAALNDQLNAELYSAYLYLSMAAYFASVNLPGFANWMRVQRLEELTHAMKFYDYLIDSGARVRLKQIDAPPTEWGSPLEVAEAVLAHERKVTGLIHKLVDLAIEERDHATNAFLQWYVNEQVEEEASADAMVQSIKRIGDSPGGIYLLDREMSQRVFNPMPTGIHGGVG